ncbi:MAG: hypothetical protein HY898_05530 [Deltaproteobacteria bacterium]|nr:hypothetical protein [Deltaproteobacteria bacterium]
MVHSRRWFASIAGVLSQCALGCGADAGTVPGTAGTGGSPPVVDPGSLVMSASGQAPAVQGYAFPSTSSLDGQFVDGWEMTFSRVLITFANLSVSLNPDRSPQDQSQTDGALANVPGPFAVDLHQGGPNPGHTGGKAIDLALFAAEDGQVDFNPELRYGIGFDVVAASPLAAYMNLDGDAQADYQEMIAKGYTVLYVGTARFKGTQCTSSNPAYDFTRLPSSVNFRFGFRAPASFINCQNPDNDPAQAFPHEKHQRGIQVKNNMVVRGQATVHLLTAFADSALHDAPAHFDPIAAQYLGLPEGGFTATLEDLAGVDFTSFSDREGKPLPWRTCTFSYSPPSSGAVSYDAQSIAVNPSATPDQALRGFGDYMTYLLASQVFLNGDGVCYVRRNYPSPS